MRIPDPTMPRVRISGRVAGPDDPTREARARLLYLLFAGGWDIENANGDQNITLSNVERTIIASDAFVFTPGATLEELFKAVSVFVGYQTLDANLKGKPTVLLNGDGSWGPFLGLLDHLNRMGTIKQDHREFLLVASQPEAVVESLIRVREEGLPDAGRHHPEHDAPMPARLESFEAPLPGGHVGNVCVFCSASIEDEAYLADGYTLGAELAAANLGCVSGAGRTGVMGAVVRGSVDAGGWTGGSNVPHIIELEGLPDGLSSFWLRPDIYTRMEVMIERSDSFVIFPGGAGTVQELFALLLLKSENHPSMRGKPVVIFDREDSGLGRFWTPLIELVGAASCEADFRVVNALGDIVPAILEEMQK